MLAEALRLFDTPTAVVVAVIGTAMGALMIARTLTAARDPWLLMWIIGTQGTVFFVTIIGMRAYQFEATEAGPTWIRTFGTALYWVFFTAGIGLGVYARRRRAT